MSSQDYAEMIEIPVSSCEIFVTPKTSDKRAKKRLLKRFKKNPFLFSQNKRNANEKSFSESTNVNAAAETEIEKEKFTPVFDEDGYEEKSQKDVYFNTDDDYSEKAENKNKKRHFKWDLVTAQVVTVFVLAVGILLTNIFWKDSGINNLLKSVFASDAATADERSYDVFDAFAPSKNEVELSEGVMTLTKSGAIYSPADGEVSSVELVNGKYTVTILHSDSFQTVITGADYAYFKKGNKVFVSTPVCYSIEGGAQVKMYDSNVILTNYSIKDDKIVWQS